MGLSASVSWPDIMQVLKNYFKAPGTAVTTAQFELLAGLGANEDLSYYDPTSSIQTQFDNITDDVSDLTPVQCLAYLGSDEATASGVAEYLDLTEAYDDASMHDNSTNPARITVPSGYNRARAWAQIRVASGTGRRTFEIHKNTSGASYDGAGRVLLPDVASGTSWRAQVSTAELVVVGGTDYFRLSVETGGAQTVRSGSDETWLMLRCWNE